MRKTLTEEPEKRNVNMDIEIFDEAKDLALSLSLVPKDFECQNSKKSG